MSVQWRSRAGGGDAAGLPAANAIELVSRLAAQAFEAGQLRAALVLAQMAALLDEPSLWRVDEDCGQPCFGMSYGAPMPPSRPRR